MSDVCACMRVYIFIQVPDTFQAHTSDRHVLNEELEDPLKVPLSESPRNPYQGLEGFIKVEEKGWEPVNDSQSLMGLGGLWPPSVLLNRGSRTWGQRPISSCIVTSFSSPGSHLNNHHLPNAQYPFGGG